jgi:hypothetical protein
MNYHSMLRLSVLIGVTQIYADEIDKEDNEIH